MNLADAAIASGFPVFACAVSKRPITAHGFHDATRDPDEIARQFAAPAAALIGIPTGETSGLDALDIDPRHGGREWETANAHRLPETRVHETPSGGRHYVFVHAPGVRNSASIVAPGIDVRGTGGYICAPPSPGYRVISDAEPAHWPDWLLKLVLNQPREPPSEPRTPTPISSRRISALVDAVVRRVSTAPEGQKHYTLRNQALYLGGLLHLNQFTPSEAVNRLLDALPPTVKDRKLAQKTAEWGVEHGAESPIDLPDREEYRGNGQTPPPDDEIPPPTDDDARQETDPPAHTDAEPAQKPRAPSLWAKAEDWTEDAIPPRPWIAKGYLLRGAVTIVAGPGSAGKSSLMIGWASALALGLQWHRFIPPAPCRVMTYNVEDDDAEQMRRFSAILRQFGKLPRDLAGKVMRVGPTTLGSLIHHDPSDNTFKFTEALQELEILIEQFCPDVVMLDPFVELHNVDENDNTAIRMVIAMFRVIAARHNIAIVILHHARKGSADSPGDPDIIRGAGALVGGSRISLTVMTMNEKDAEKLGMSQDARRAYFRVDGAKMNYAPIHEAEWFQRIEYELDNGDLVAAAHPWEPPTDFVADEQKTGIKEEIEKGTNGLPFSPRISDKEPRSITHLLTRHGIVTHAGQKRFLAELLADGFTEERFKDRHRKPAAGLRSPAGEPPADWITPSLS